MRPMGEITAEMEELVTEMIDDHQLQWHEILGLMHAYLQSHRPDAQEEYEDGSRPVYFYGAVEEG